MLTISVDLSANVRMATVQTRMVISEIRLKYVGQALVLALLLAGLTAAFSNGGQVRKTQTASDNLLGNYLSGRFARGRRDTPTAADFYGRALAKDPKNAVILEQAFLLELAAANWPRAVALAKDLIERAPKNHLARFVLGGRDFKRGEFAAARKHFAKADRDPISDLTKLLAQAWIALAEGDTKSAFKTLDRTDKAEWSLHYRRYHKALIADIAKRPKIAAREYSRAFKKNPRSGRLAIAYARHAANVGDKKLAKKVLETHLARASHSPRVAALLAQLEKDETPGILLTSTAGGIAEIFYGIGDALAGESDFEIGTIYLQLALYLNPDFTLANVSLGNVYRSNGKHELAIKAYDAVPETSPLWLNSQIKKAFGLNSLERVDEAKTMLDALARKVPGDTRPLDALGDILRVHKRFEEAVPYYNRAIKLVKTPKAQHASFYYSRGICFERLDQWAKAETDFKKAIELNPDQPLVLNYLGYSWVDQGIHLKEAMDLIRKAVKLDPNDGYFVDSLGWAHYRLGNYEQAVEHLERATELRPDDPVINDHLGDGYWLVGRRFEARYQWSQALALDPEPEDEKKIEEKLANGLDEPRQIEAQATPPSGEVKKDN